MIFRVRLKWFQVSKKVKQTLGQEINFDFEVERDAIVGQFSCGAWLNGEYYIIDGTLGDYYGAENYLGVIRKV